MSGTCVSQVIEPKSRGPMGPSGFPLLAALDGEVSKNGSRHSTLIDRVRPHVRGGRPASGSLGRRSFLAVFSHGTSTFD